MAYILGGVTLLNPKVFQREFLELSKTNTTFKGESLRRVENRKERFVLTYQHLTEAQADTILAEYNLNEVRTFEVTEDNLTIGPTDVLVEVSGREYILGGKTYLSNLDLVLTEVT